MLVTYKENYQSFLKNDIQTVFIYDFAVLRQLFVKDTKL